MAYFKQAVITHTGANMLANDIAGIGSIEFTKMVSGAGEYTEEEKSQNALKGRTALKDQRQEFAFNTIKVKSERSVLLKSVISNQELEEGYRITEVGIYAREKGTEGDGFLYSVALAVEADFLPPFNGLDPIEITQEYYATVSDSAAAAIVADPRAYVLYEDMQALENDIAGRLRKLQSLAPTELIPGNSDLDDYTDPGCFRVADSAVAKTIAHTPVTNAGYTLDVYKPYGPGNNKIVMQIARVFDFTELARYRGFDDTWSDWVARKYTDTTYNPMTGATASAAGKAGLVPAPAAGDQNKVLKGDGSWADEKLKNPTYINGMTFTGTPEYGELSNTRMCSTAGNVAEKVVTFTGFSGYKNYARINVKFAYTNSASNPTLKINDTDPKPIYYKNRPVMPGAIKALKIYAFVYLLNGDRWEILGDLGEDNQNTAKTYYVSPDGDDSLGDGSSAHPWREINYAISHCPYGSCCNIYVEGGMYSPIHALDKHINLYLKGDITFDGTGLNTDKSNNSPLVYMSNCILLFAKSGSDNNNRIVHFCNANYCIVAVNRSLFHTDIKVELEFDNINNRAIHINYSDFVIYGKIHFKSTCNLERIIGAYFTSRIVISSESNNRSVFDAVTNTGISCHNDIQVSLVNVDVTDNVANMVSGSCNTIVAYSGCTFANNIMTQNSSALLINDINNQSSVETVDPMTATEDGFAADAKLTGDALKGINVNLAKKADTTTVNAALAKKADTTALSAKANASALGTQCTFSLSGTTLTITPK